MLAIDAAGFGVAAESTDLLGAARGNLAAAAVDAVNLRTIVRPDDLVVTLFVADRTWRGHAPRQ